MTRQKEVFVRYFTDKHHGDMEKSLAAALEVRDCMLADIEAGHPFADVCSRYKKHQQI
jgi:hypothetical protein